MVADSQTLAGYTREELTNDEGNHGCSIATSSLKALDELLHLPYFNLSTRALSVWRSVGEYIVLREAFRGRYAVERQGGAHRFCRAWCSDQ